MGAVALGADGVLRERTASGASRVAWDALQGRMLAALSPDDRRRLQPRFQQVRW